MFSNRQPTYFTKNLRKALLIIVVVFVYLYRQFFCYSIILEEEIGHSFPPLQNYPVEEWKTIGTVY
jgi:hypothetical protein